MTMIDRPETDAGGDDRPAVAPTPPTRLERVRETVAPALAAAGRVVRAVRNTVSPLGWVFTIGAIALWIVALQLGWRELFVVAAIISVAVLVCLLFLIGRTAYDVTIDLTRTRVVVGEKAYGAMTLRNASSRAILPSRVVLPVGQGRGTFDVPRLSAGEEREEIFAIPTTRRAVLNVGPVSVQRGDPLGLFERTQDRRDAVDLFVHPRTVRLDGLSLGFLRDLEGLPATELSRDDVSFHALREYQPGDDRRHVHWRSSARTGVLMVRQYEETRRSHFVVGLSTHPGDYRTPGEFELAISVAGSVGLRALRDSRTLEVRTNRGELPSRGGRRFLDALSGLEHSRPREGGLVAVAGAVAAHSAEASVAVLVGGSAVTATDVRIACARLPQSVRTVAIIADEGAAPSLRRVGDADVITIGEIDQLAPGLRKVLA